jgi:urea transport system permease protein
MRLNRLLSVFILMLGFCCHIAQSNAQTVDDATLRPLVQALAGDNFENTTKAISDLVKTGDPRVSKILDALSAGDLYVAKADKTVFLGKRDGSDYAATDALTGAKLDPVPRSAAEKIKVNNRLRRDIAAAIGGLTLMSDNIAERRSAAEAILKTRDPESIPLLDQAIAVEKDAGVKALMQQAKAAAVLNSDAADDVKIAAITEVSAGNSRDALGLLTPLENVQGPVGEAAKAAIDSINTKLAFWNAIQNVVYGLSLGSVLLLAAIGLAITFGVMGVINMAHGEMVMIGAYTTFVVQQIIRTSAPGLFDYSLLIALPAAFLVSGGIGVVIERGIIRFLYGGNSFLVRRIQRAGRQPVLDGWVVRPGLAHTHMVAPVDHCFCSVRLCHPATGPEEDHAWFAHAGSHPKSPHGLLDGNQDAVGRCTHLRPRLRHRRNCRRGA